MIQKPDRGWAVFHRGAVLVDTVAWTRRGAIVNWLIMHAERPVMRHHTDMAIEEMWIGCGGGVKGAGEALYPQVVEVEITVAKP